MPKITAYAWNKIFPVKEYCWVGGQKKVTSLSEWVRDIQIHRGASLKKNGTKKMQGNEASISLRCNCKITHRKIFHNCIKYCWKENYVQFKCIWNTLCICLFPLSLSLWLCLIRLQKNVCLLALVSFSLLSVRLCPCVRVCVCLGYGSMY